MRLEFTTRALLCLALTTALVVARPSPESDAGYSYQPPPNGVRFNHQPPWSAVSPESRTRASEVTVEQVPIRLVQQSSELHRQPPIPPPPNRGAYYFPSSSARLQQQQPQQYFRAEHAVQQNRGSFPPPRYNAPQQYYQQNPLYQQYRGTDIPQQRGAYVFPPQNNVNPNYQPQYERQQQARNIPFNNQGSNSHPEYQVNNYNNNYHTNTASNNYQNNPPPSNNFHFNPTNNFNPTLANNHPAPQNQYPNSAPNNYNSAPNNNYPTSSSPQNAPNNNNYLPKPATTNGYNYNAPSSEAPSEEIQMTTTEASPTNLTDFGPRISIAISKSTVIHTGKGSYKIDEKTGLPQPLIAEAHSYATLPNDNDKSKASTVPGDNLKGEGTGNIPIIARGTPPEDEEEEQTTEENETEENTEQPTTEPPAEEPATPAPTPQSAQFPYLSSSWPLKTYGGHHAHVVVAPGQTQYFALGTSEPSHQAHYYTPAVTTPQYVTPYVQPTAAGQYYTQPIVPYAHQYGAYHPSALTRSASLRWPFAQYFPIVIRDPFATMYTALNSVLEYGPEADICRGKAAEAPAEAPQAEGPVEQEPQQEPQQELDSQQQPDTAQQQFGRMVINRGGIALAGPGGVAETGHGGTAIVGPGGTAYSSPTGVSVVGPGGKVLLQGANSETVLAKGPIIYYHKA